MHITEITPSAFKSGYYKKQEPSFQGLFSSANKLTKHAADVFISKNSGRLGVSGNEVKKYYTPLNKDRMTFFSEIVKRINMDNYERGMKFEAEKDLNTVDRIYNAVEKPAEPHLKIIKNRKYSISDTEQIFKLSEKNPENRKLWNLCSDWKPKTLFP